MGLEGTRTYIWLLVFKLVEVLVELIVLKVVLGSFGALISKCCIIG